MFGADQIWVYDDKTVPAAVVLFGIWVLLAARWFRRGGARRVLAGIPFQICLLVSAGILVIPGWILLPGFGHPLVYLSDRMSLALGVCLCAFVARARVGRFVQYGIVALTVYYFGMVYLDERAMNRFEDEMTEVVHRLPAGQRVLGPFASYDRIDSLWHTIDRVCIGHCFSYGNYEASSRQFRIRATGPSPVVLTDEHSLDLIIQGNFVPQPRDLPLYEVYMDGSGRLNLRSLGPGDKSLIFKSNLSTNTGAR
jgi:hypothetical protein